MPITGIKYKLLFLLLIPFLFAHCTASKYHYNPYAKIAAPDLKEDLTVLKKILEANHPSLYWYTTKDSLDKYFEQTIDNIHDSLTEHQFRSRVAWYLSNIKCGHTSVRSSEAYGYFFEVHKPNRFPLLIKTWNDSLIFLASLNRQDTILKRGTVITSIEHYNGQQLLDSMYHFISTDGHGDNFKNQAISFNFPLYYNYAFPLRDSFAITYIDSGTEKQLYVKLNRPLSDTSKKGKPPASQPSRPSRKQLREIRILSKRSLTYDSAGGFAYMRINTFNEGHLRSFFRRSFAELQDKNIQHLVIDLRENSGGSISLATLLTRYLKDKKFHTADTAAAVNRSLDYGRYIRPALPYKIAMRLTTRKEQDGKFHFRQLERHYYEPFRRHHFDGDVYIVQGGYTFSAAAMVVLQLKGQHNVTVTGEQTGGGSYGTSAVHLPEIVLPHSKLRVTLPLYRLVFDRSRKKSGKGIYPDIYVYPSSTDIRNGIDPKMNSIKMLIEARKK